MLLYGCKSVQNDIIACLAFSKDVSRLVQILKYKSALNCPRSFLFFGSYSYPKDTFWRKNTLLLDMLSKWCTFPLVKFIQNIDIFLSFYDWHFCVLTWHNKELKYCKFWPGFLHKRLFKKTMKILCVVVLKSGQREFLL